MHKLILAPVALLALTASVDAARIRYHYAPNGDSGCVQLVPGPDGAPGERLSLVGMSPSPYHTPPPRPTRWISVLHPDTKRFVNIPLALPPDTPTIQHWGSTLVYDYGSESVEIRFLPNGSVDVIYNNGLGRNP